MYTRFVSIYGVCACVLVCACLRACVWLVGKMDGWMCVCHKKCSLVFFSLKKKDNFTPMNLAVDDENQANVSCETK